MSKEKFRLENKLGTSGAITSIVLVITTIITGLLFMFSAFLRFILHDSDRMESFLETFGAGNTKIHETFDISRSISWLGSAPTLIVLTVVILLLLIIWCSFYKLNSVYVYRAFRGYGISLICISCLSFVFGLFAGPVMYHFADSLYSNYGDALKIGKWLLLFAALPVFALGLLMLLVSLFTAFPAKTDMKRPRKSGEKDVSFIMDDEDINQLGNSVPGEACPQVSVDDSQELNVTAYKDISPVGSEASEENIETVEAEIVEKACPNCGAKVNDGDVFCMGCGTKL